MGGSLPRRDENGELFSGEGATLSAEATPRITTAIRHSQASLCLGGGPSSRQQAARQPLWPGNVDSDRCLASHRTLVLANAAADA